MAARISPACPSSPLELARRVAGSASRVFHGSVTSRRLSSHRHADRSFGMSGAGVVAVRHSGHSLRKRLARQTSFGSAMTSGLGAGLRPPRRHHPRLLELRPCVPESQGWETNPSAPSELVQNRRPVVTVREDELPLASSTKAKRFAPAAVVPPQTRCEREPFRQTPKDQTPLRVDGSSSPSAWCNGDPTRAVTARAPTIPPAGAVSGRPLRARKGDIQDVRSARKLAGEPREAANRCSSPRSDPFTSAADMTPPMDSSATRGGKETAGGGRPVL